MRLPEQRILRLMERHDQIAARLEAATDPSEIIALSRERSELDPLVEAARALRRVEHEALELEQMVLDLPRGDEMAKMAMDEAQALRARAPELTAAIARALVGQEREDKGAAVVEVRAGTGGEEAALFAADLVRMYTRYGAKQGWRVSLASVSETGLGGMKEAILEIEGAGAYGKLKFESGVHRVQRVPATEAGGRIHTSAATVAVLAEAEDVDVQIDDKDLRIDVFRASGPGGQSVNTTDSAVRVVHLPTGITVSMQDEKSQHKNKAKAMKILRARLWDLARANAHAARAAERKGQVGSGDRSERIRTYNFPQGRVSDHRIDLTLYDLPAVIEGNLDKLIEPLLAEDAAQRLAAMEDAG